MMNKVSIITVNYNQAEVTEEMLQSIDWTPLISEIIVVDNGSSINQVPQWTTKYPEVTFIRSEENLGFAGGNNLGVSHATGDYLFFVNNDTEFTENLVETLAEQLDKDPNIGMISPRINYYYDKLIVQYAGFTPMNYYTCQNRSVGKGEKHNVEQIAAVEPTGYVHGAAMMVRREAILKAGLMDEIFFLYYEEFDWCERIRKAGYKITICHQALIYHKESISVGKSSKLKEYYMNRNRLLFIRRNASSLQRNIFYGYFALLVAPRNIIRYLLSGRYEFVPVLWKAIKWNMRPLSSIKKAFN
jgi:GT2 family glycosyltransferase